MDLINVALVIVIAYLVWIWVLFPDRSGSVSSSSSSSSSSSLTDTLRRVRDRMLSGLSYESQPASAPEVTDSGAAPSSANNVPDDVMAPVPESTVSDADLIGCCQTMPVNTRPMSYVYDVRGEPGNSVNKRVTAISAPMPEIY